MPTNTVKRFCSLPLIGFVLVTLNGCSDDLSIQRPNFVGPPLSELVKSAPNLARCLEDDDIGLDQPLDSVFELACIDRKIEIDALVQLSNLKELLLVNIALEDVKPLMQLSNLKELTLGEMKLGDVSGFRHENLTSLAMSFGELEHFDVAAFPNLRQLYLNGNNFTELDLSSASKLKSVHLYYNRLTQLELDFETQEGLELYGLPGQPIYDLDLQFVTKHSGSRLLDYVVFE